MFTSSLAETGLILQDCCFVTYVCFVTLRTVVFAALKADAHSFQEEIFRTPMNYGSMASVDNLATVKRERRLTLCWQFGVCASDVSVTRDLWELGHRNG